MKKQFKDIAGYVKCFDGRNKPKMDFQVLYKLFPEFEFEPAKDFGEYKAFGQAYGQKILDMIIKDNAGNCVLMVYREYDDADETLAYIA